MPRTTRSNKEAPIPNSIVSEYPAVRRKNKNTIGTGSVPIVLIGSTEGLNDSGRTETIEVEVALDSESDHGLSDTEMASQTPTNSQSNTSTSILAGPSSSTSQSTTDDLFNHKQQI